MSKRHILDTVSKTPKRGRPRVSSERMAEVIRSTWPELSDRGQRRVYWTAVGQAAVGTDALSRFRDGISVWVELGMLAHLVDTETLRGWAREINVDPTLKAHEAAKILRRFRHDIMRRVK